MPTDDDGDDAASGRVPPPPPDDRLWRHPSEVSAFGPGRTGGTPSAVLAPAPRGATWPVAVVAGLVGAALCGGLLALTGQLSLGADELAIERVKVTPFVPPPQLFDGEDVTAVTDRVRPAVVRLLITRDGDDSQACGVVVRDDGVVVTSAHEVSGATAITVVLADGRELEGEIVGSDLPTDVAVITVESDDLTAALLGSAEDLRPGTPAVALGATRRGDPAVSTGVVSALGQRLDRDGKSLHGLIQTDAPIGPGWAGGPLVDDTGAVIGITMRGDDGASGFGFATPIDLVRRLAGELLATGKVTRSWLGIEGTDVPDATADRMGLPGGAEVQRVMPGSPAAAAGLETGDVVTDIGDQAIRSSSDLVVALREHKPGDAVTVGYWRSGRRYEVDVTVDHYP